jgi:hypothetical protein
MIRHILTKPTILIYLSGKTTRSFTKREVGGRSREGRRKGKVRTRSRRHKETVSLAS